MIERHASGEPLLNQPESCPESQGREDQVDPRLNPLEPPEAISRLVREITGAKSVSDQARSQLEGLRPRAIDPAGFVSVRVHPPGSNDPILIARRMRGALGERPGLRKSWLIVRAEEKLHRESDSQEKHERHQHGQDDVARQRSRENA